jgi:hypothetical protein
MKINYYLKTRDKLQINDLDALENLIHLELVQWKTILD